jgi:hypothetical protein
MPASTTQRLKILKALLIFSVLSTGIHFTHNFVEIDSYPEELVPGPVTQVAIVAFWPLLTAIGIHGYRLYRRGRLQEAHVMLATYSLLGISTLAHFLDASPDIPAFFYATIFTDALAGASILAFVIFSALDARRAARSLTQES